MKAVIIIICVLLLVYIGYRTYTIITLDRGLDQKIKQGAVILDVRTEKEYRMGHIEGAINIPLSRLHADSIPLDKNRTIITCCSHGLRSVKAAALLKEHGYKDVYNGGAWTDLEADTKLKK